MSERTTMSLKPERSEDLLEVIRLLEALKTELSGAEDFDSVRMDSHLVTALTSAKAALHISAVSTGLAPERGIPGGDHSSRS